MKQLMVLLLVCMGLQAGAQEIAGQVLDNKREPLYDAEVLVVQQGAVKYALCTDYDGYYIAKPLQADMYEVIFHFAGHDSVTMKDVVVSEGRTTVNARLGAAEAIPKNLVKAFKRPLVNEERPTVTLSEMPTIYFDGNRPYGDVSIGGPRSDGSMYIISGVKVSDLKSMEVQPVMQRNTMVLKEFRQPPAMHLTDMAVAVCAPQVYQRQRGAGLNIGGGGAYGTLYVVDGMVINPLP